MEEENNKPAVQKRILTTQTDDDTIVQYLRGMFDADLTPALALRLKRMEICKSHIEAKVSRAKVLPIIKAELDVSLAEAYRIYDDTISIYNALSSTTGREFWVDLLIGNMAETRAKAIADHDWKSAATSDRNMFEAIKEFFGGHEAKLYEDLQPPDISFVFNPKQNISKEQARIEFKKLLRPKRRNNIAFDEGEILNGDDPGE